MGLFPTELWFTLILTRRFPSLAQSLLAVSILVHKIFLLLIYHFMRLYSNWCTFVLSVKSCQKNSSTDWTGLGQVCWSPLPVASLNRTLEWVSWLELCDIVLVNRCLLQLFVLLSKFECTGTLSSSRNHTFCKIYNFKGCLFQVICLINLISYVSLRQFEYLLTRNLIILEFNQ